MNKSIKIILGLFVGLILLAGVFSAGILVGFFIPGGSQPPIVNDLFPLQPTAAPEQLSATPEDMQTLFAPFWEAWNIVHSEFVDQPLDDVTLMRGARCCRPPNRMRTPRTPPLRALRQH